MAVENPRGTIAASGSDRPALPPPSGGPLGVLRNGLAVIGPDRKRLWGTVALAFVIGVIETALLYMVAAVAIAISGNSHLARLGPADLGIQVSIPSACGIGLALVATLMLLSIPLAQLMASLSTRAMLRLRGRMLTAYLHSSLQYRDTQREGLLQQLVGEYALRAENSVQQLALGCVGVAMFAAVIAGAIVSSPLLALGLIIGLGITFALLAPVTKRFRQDVTKPVLTNREIVGHVAQAARIGQEISAFHVADAVARQLLGGIKIAATAMGKLRFEARLVPNLFQYGAIGLVLILIAALASTSAGGMEGVAPLALLLVRALTYVRQLQRSFHTAREMAPYITAVETELEQLEEHAWDTGSHALTALESLRFEGVNYAYKPGENVLKDISFSIDQGEMVGIVGPSGSGKSTLTGVLLRLRKQTSGKVTAAGVPLMDVSAESWAALTGYVPQDSRLIFGTAADNIRFFRPGFSQEQIETAARAAHVHDEIMALPHGYDTVIGPGARGLSGGQSQRLSIARALLGQPALIVMDEPTSALDARSEALISQTLAELKGSATIILIAHRPATLELCDRILEVRYGVLTELPTQTHAAKA